MTEWKELSKDSQQRWDQNAAYWDDYMGEVSNRFHREIIRPDTEKLLSIKKGHRILDIACGNGNFSRRLADQGATVAAFDYSPKMIERARARSKEYLDKITYQTLDATDYGSLVGIGEESFDSAVANMALMDISEITPLINALHKLVKPNGYFVFSILHPCFHTPNMREIRETEVVNGEQITRESIQISKYLTSEAFERFAIKGQPVTHYYFHRPLSVYIRMFSEAGFVLDGLEEPVFKNDNAEIPFVMIMRFKKF